MAFNPQAELPLHLTIHVAKVIVFVSVDRVEMVLVKPDNPPIQVLVRKQPIKFSVELVNHYWQVVGDQKLKQLLVGVTVIMELVVQHVKELLVSLFEIWV